MTLIDHRTLRALAAGILALALGGCEVDLAGQTLDGGALLPQGEGRNGRVLMLAPSADALIEIDPSTRTWESIPVGRDPRSLERPPGSDVLFTMEPGRESISRIAVDRAVETVDLGGPFNTVHWAPDGLTAIVTIDSENLEVVGSLNPNAIALVRDTGSSIDVEHYTLTFPPEQVVFDPASTRALIATSSRLHVLDLETLDEVGIPFSADSSNPRRPALVVPSADGLRALVTVQGRTELFVISLDPVLIENVFALPRQATDVQFSADASTAVVADGTGRISFLDLSSFESEDLVLPHAANRILSGFDGQGQFALLFHDGGGVPYLSRVELDGTGKAPDEADSFQLEDGVRGVWIEPGGTAAVIFHDGLPMTGSVGGVLTAQSLSLFNFEQRAPSRILLDAPAHDLIFIEAGALPSSPDPFVMVVLKESGRLVRYDLRTYEQVVLDTYALPTQIGIVPAGQGVDQQFFVVHDQDMGLVSFVPLDTTETPPGGFPAVAGMGLDGLLDRRR